MSKKSKRAIKALNKHLESITTISNVQEGNTWKASLKDTINLYIGADSSISQRLDSLHFTRVDASPIRGGVITTHVYDEFKKQNFIDLIGAAIKHIDSNGTYINPNKSNIISSFSNAEIISGFVFIIGLTFGIGNYIGKHEKDKESLRTEEHIKEIEKENNSLIHSIDSLKQILIQTSKSENMDDKEK